MRVKKKLASKKNVGTRTNGKNHKLPKMNRAGRKEKKSQREKRYNSSLDRLSHHKND